MAWICDECGERYKTRERGSFLGTWHMNFCDWCGVYKSVTSSRKYGHPPAPKETK